LFFFFSSRRRHTRSKRDWSSDVCSSDLTSISTRRSATGVAEPPRAGRVLLGAGAAATLGIQLVLAIRTRDLPVYRGAALLWSLALLVWAGRSRAPAVGRILPRLACALAA